ncbi:MAG: hydantoinase/oxoprolinase family protein [Paracoccaceae bacterium]|nr:hydantoinase/oxoprolinase family protein [Paracoccaceae bacterium]
MDRSDAAAPLVLLGVDTGGTYTDAVVLDEARAGDGPAALIGKAKHLTTRDDLARGIGGAIDAAMAAARVHAEQIALVSLSTTLATNALVEGNGGRVGLVMIGFDPADAARAGLAEALGQDPQILISGGHGPMGDEQAPPDLAALEAWLPAAEAEGEAEGYAVCGYFAVRDPAHEIAARDLIRAKTGRPVTCSHELSARIGGPKRGLTALLNARLIGMIDRLIGSGERILAERGIEAPLMVVRGDGALVSADFARVRPIETILSGPAASIVGAAWLTGLEDAVVSDIGGTTTDIAILTGGRPRLDPQGARVGGWRTTVEAVGMTTHGLGGDSEVHLNPVGLETRILLGPRRMVPVALLAAEHPALVHETLDTQLATELNTDLDGRFLVPQSLPRPAGLAAHESQILDALAVGPRPAGAVLRTRLLRTALRKLVARGLVMVSGLTPSDAAHVLGIHAAWDRAAAEKVARLFARQRGNDGKRVAEDTQALCRRIIYALTRRSAEVVLDAAFAEDGFEQAEPSRSFLAQSALDRHAGLVRPSLTLGAPLVGLGASAPAYYPAVAEMVGGEDAVPEHADVANAIGAVVGQVRIARSATISCPAEGRFRLHLPDGAEDFTNLETARGRAEAALEAAARMAAAEAGAGAVHVTLEADVSEATIEGKTMVIEAIVTATATGRPRLAEPEDEPSLPSGFAGL